MCACACECVCVGEIERERKSVSGEKHSWGAGCRKAKSILTYFGTNETRELESRSMKYF